MLLIPYLYLLPCILSWYKRGSPAVDSLCPQRGLSINLNNEWNLFCLTAQPIHVLQVCFQWSYSNVFRKFWAPVYFSVITEYIKNCFPPLSSTVNWNKWNIVIYRWSIKFETYLPHYLHTFTFQNQNKLWSNFIE